MKKQRQILLNNLTRHCQVFCLFLCLPGCGLINPEEPVPAILRIPAYHVETAESEGSDSQLLTEVWIYVDNALLGAYPIPAAIPVLFEGRAGLRIFPGIKVNGIRSTPDIYPFLETFDEDMDFQPGSEIVIQPVFTYKPNLNFVFIEDFETGTGFLDDQDGDVATSLKSTAEEVFEGEQSGVSVLTPEHPLLEVATLNTYPLPTNNAPVYLEIHYQNDMEFTIGLIGHGNGFEASAPVLTIRERDVWNKIYIDLTESLSLSKLDGYQIYIRAVHNQANQTESRIYLDNMKLIHFNT